MNWTNFTIGLSMVTIVVMGFIVLSPAHASSGCADKHENVTRFNPTELSDYQKCVHEFYGRTSGAHAGFVWFAVDGKFYHIDKDEILNATGSDIEHLVVKTILEDGLAEKIAQYETDIEVMARVLGDRNEKVLELQGELDELQKEIDTIKSRTGTHTNSVNVRINEHGVTLSHSEVNIAERRFTTEDLLNSDLNIVGLADDLVDEIRVVMESIATEAYNEGYADGYRDGFAAGVASVQ